MKKFICFTFHILGTLIHILCFTFKFLKLLLNVLKLAKYGVGSSLQLVTHALADVSCYTSDGPSPQDHLHNEDILVQEIINTSFHNLPLKEEGLKDDVDPSPKIPSLMKITWFKNDIIPTSPRDALPSITIVDYNFTHKPKIEFQKEHFATTYSSKGTLESLHRLGTLCLNPPI